MNRSEEADDYHAIVAQLSDGWRIIACRSDIQWILQRSVGQRHGRTRWEGRSFCRTKEALIRFSRTHASPVDPAAQLLLDALPERFPEKLAEGIRRSIPGAVTSAIIAGPPGIGIGASYYNERGGVEGTANDLRKASSLLLVLKNPNAPLVELAE